jgi:short-subunit dehydrogenase
MDSQADRPVAAITGGSSGIGAEFARQLAGRGYDLILTARRRDRMEALARELGCRVEIVVADLAVDADVERVADRLRSEPRLRLLVNNAGFGTLGRFWKVEVADEDRMHRVHVLATMRLTHAVLKPMMERGSGGVINVSSVAGFFAYPGSVSYSATKAWINRFTECLGLELIHGGSRVRMQALCPGFTYSEFHDVMGIDRSSVPKSMWMNARDVVAASLSGLDAGRLFVIPGWRYRLLVAVGSVIPRWMVRSIAGRFRSNFRPAGFDKR